uniref:Uncharacterized protein n=1 Tax=Solanum lycopersicum TaxID=4081 RepID=A0A3Q7EXV0_SOLLC
VKHYQKEDCPSEVGSRSQQHTYQSINGSSYERRDCLKKSEERLSSKSLAIWKYPPKFHLNKKWRLVDGKESEEAIKQVNRKRTVIEAVFHNKFAFPPNQTPVVRTISVEEEPTHDLTILVATTVAALQEQGSLIDANLLVRLLLNLMNERSMDTDAVSLNAAHAGSVKFVPLTMTKPETSVNEQGAPSTANIREST